MGKIIPSTKLKQKILKTGHSRKLDPTRFPAILYYPHMGCQMCQNSNILLNEEVGYKRVRPGRKQFYLSHFRRYHSYYGAKLCTDTFIHYSASKPVLAPEREYKITTRYHRDTFSKAPARKKWLNRERSA